MPHNMKTHSHNPSNPRFPSRSSQTQIQTHPNHHHHHHSNRPITSAAVVLVPHTSDIGLRNIIDKLAEFVARNGPEFEAITKAKQQGNPKFGFLYGGDYYQYYQWRVSSEQSSKLYL